MELLECLGQIRSLLIVQMGPEEERLMIQSIGLVWGINSVYFLNLELVCYILSYNNRTWDVIFLSNVTLIYGFCCFFQKYHE